MSKKIIEKMEETIKRSQRALDGEWGETEPSKSQTIIWFQVRIEHWIRMLKEVQSSRKGEET